MGSTSTRKGVRKSSPAKSQLKSNHSQPISGEADITLWTEALAAAELVLLHASPVFYGFGVPRGDGSGVILIPGFLGTDAYLTELHAWLARLGYRPYFSGIGLNADCPNLLAKWRLNKTIEKALLETERKVHLIGHSLGGILARSAAGQWGTDVASVITLGAPIRGLVMHRVILRAAETVRKDIIEQHGRGVLPSCYTGRCTCDFITSLQRKIPKSVLETAIYTRHDGVVDWQCCMTRNTQCDFEVAGTHIGMAFNPSAYTIIADRLAQAQCD
jgi:pimeloyl-ACP methyl ester carboxylesterase